MNGWDAMLNWLATRGPTDWGAAKSAAQRLSAVYEVGTDDLPRDHARRWITPLIDLGHAEFDGDTKQVRVIPPGLVWCSPWQSVVLYGAWATDRLASLSTVLDLRVHDPGNGPAVRTAHSATADVARSVTDELKVWLSVDAGERVLQSLPLVHTMLTGLSSYEGSLDGRWQEIAFNGHACGWKDCRNPLTAPGIFRRLTGGVRRVLVRDHGDRIELPTPDHQRAAIWSLAPAQGWKLTNASQTLAVPAGLPPLPILVLRGLTSASATRPVRSEDSWVFRHVSRDAAEQAARIMGRCLSII